jgi:hypothetical protein
MIIGTCDIEIALPPHRVIFVLSAIAIRLYPSTNSKVTYPPLDCRVAVCRIIISPSNWTPPMGFELSHDTYVTPSNTYFTLLDSVTVWWSRRSMCVTVSFIPNGTWTPTSNRSVTPSLSSSTSTLRITTVRRFVLCSSLILDDVLKNMFSGVPEDSLT